MNTRQKRFVAEYLKNPNATKAAQRAGYSKKTAYSIGQKLLKKVEIKAAVDAGHARVAGKLEISAERVLAELALMGFSNAQDYSDGRTLKEMTREQAAAVQELTTVEYREGYGKRARRVTRRRFKLADKTRALELIGRNLKMFTDKVEVTNREDRLMVLVNSFGREHEKDLAEEQDGKQDIPSDAASS